MPFLCQTDLSQTYGNTKKKNIVSFLHVESLIQMNARLSFSAIVLFLYMLIVKSDASCSFLLKCPIPRVRACVF